MHSRHNYNHSHCSPISPNKIDGSTFRANLITRLSDSIDFRKSDINGVLHVSTSILLPECAEFVGIYPGPNCSVSLTFKVPDWYIEDMVYIRVSVPEGKTPMQIVKAVGCFSTTHIESKTVKIGINWFSFKIEAWSSHNVISSLIEKGCTIIKQSLTIDEQTQKLINFDAEESIPESKPSVFQLFKEALKTVLEYSKDADWNAWARPIVNGDCYYLRIPSLENLLNRIQVNPCDQQSWDISYASRAVLEAGILLCKTENNEAYDWQVKQAADNAISNIQSHLRNINNERVRRENLSKQNI